MTRRALTVLLHWSVVFLLLAMLKGGTAAPTVRWSFVLAGGLLAGMALAGGMLGRPGPKLTGLALAVYTPMHLGLYALLAVAVALNAAELAGLILPGRAWTALLLLLGAGALHGIYHMWRHTALNDGALRRMTPRIWHKHL